MNWVNWYPIVSFPARITCSPLSTGLVWKSKSFGGWLATDVSFRMIRKRDLAIFPLRGSIKLVVNLLNNCVIAFLVDRDPKRVYFDCLLHQR